MTAKICHAISSQPYMTTLKAKKSAFKAIGLARTKRNTRLHVCIYYICINMFPYTFLAEIHPYNMKRIYACICFCVELLNDKTRKMLYHQEMESRLLAAQALLEGKGRSSGVFVVAQNIAYAKPMFLTVWATMLAVLRYIFTYQIVIG